jgi:hypothetical protein
MLRCARKRARKWEAILATWGLANYQLKNAGTQRLCANTEAIFSANDPDLSSAWWQQSALRNRYDFRDLVAMHRVPVQRAVRKVPEWSASDIKCRILLLRLYPRLLVERRPGRDARKGRGLRRMAAITALVIYRCFRQCVPARVVAEELGISPSAVSNRVDKLMLVANELFGVTADGKAGGHNARGRSGQADSRELRR